MPVHLRERSGKTCVVESDGTLKKCFNSREAAMEYMKAINMKSKSSGFEEIEEMASAAHAPAIQITSDGTAKGTKLLLNGVEIPFSGIDFYCNDSDDYKSCSMSVRVREQGSDGLVVERSFNLRHSPQVDQPKVASNG